MSTSPCTGTSSCLRFISLTTLLLAFSLPAAMQNQHRQPMKLQALK